MTTTTKKKITKKTVPTVEEMILNNAQEKVETHEVYDVFNDKCVYKVTNLEINNKPSYMAGTMIAQFFGTDNAKAKEELQKGAKEVILVEHNGDKTIELYKIEVVE